MDVPEPGTADRTGLVDLVRDFAVATARGGNRPTMRSVTELLARVRQALGMDIAFISQVRDERREFVVTSIDPASPNQLVQPGRSDPLIDTYCKLILEGTLPAVTRDTREHPEVAGLPITRQLGIGAYLSVPIVLQDGSVFGTLCCFSHAPRSDLRQQDAQALRDVANLIAAGVGRTGKLKQTLWPQAGSDA